MRSGETAAPSKPSEAVEADDESGEEVQTPEGTDDVQRGGGILGRTVGAILGVGTERQAGPAETEDEGAGEEPDRSTDQAGGEERKAEETESGDQIHLNRATFEELREIGFSVTQATRVITYRERQDGFKSLDELGNVPGMPSTFLSEVRPKLTV
jgi:hypothetical protein